MGTEPDACPKDGCDNADNCPDGCKLKSEMEAGGKTAELCPGVTKTEDGVLRGQSSGC